MLSDPTQTLRKDKTSDQVILTVPIKAEEEVASIIQKTEESIQKQIQKRKNRAIESLKKAQKKAHYQHVNFFSRIFYVY